MNETTPCKACGKPILWVRTEAGKTMPLDPEPCADGNVVLGTDGKARVLKKGEDSGPFKTFKSHYATCTQPARFRKE